MDICPTCKNQMATRQVRDLESTGCLGKPLFKRVLYCPYCEWKGITGPGKQLREILKEYNNETRD